MSKTTPQLGKTTPLEDRNTHQQGISIVREVLNKYPLIHNGDSIANLSAVEDLK